MEFANRKDFRDYAEVCFREFGDRVKQWITLNEPSSYSIVGYANGMFPPRRCSNFLGLNCSAGDSSTEPYIVTHHLILAHAEAAKLYRKKYQVTAWAPLIIYIQKNIDIFWILSLEVQELSLNKEAS